jgi:hypothetical protein
MIGSALGFTLLTQRRRWLVVFLVMVGVAATFISPPVFEHVAGH